MVATTPAFSTLLDVAVYQVYIDTRKERPLEYQMIFNVRDMPWQNQQDREMAGLGTMPSKPEGQQFVLDQPIEGGTVTYTAVPYGLAMEVTFEMWDDDRFGVMGEMSAELARSSRNRIEVDAAVILNSAFDTGVNGFDATSLISTTHTSASGSTYSNRPAVDTTLSLTGIQDGVKNFEATVNARGLPIMIAPSMLIIDPNDKYLARELLGSAGKPFTADNEMNSLLDDDLKVMVYHYLTTNTFWFMVAGKGIHDLNFQWRNRPMFDSFDDPRTKNAVFTVYQRHTKGFGSARGIYGSQ